MIIGDLENKLLNDIDVAYEEAIRIRLQNIQESINDLILNYKSNDLSLFGLANLEAIKDFDQLPTSEKLPSLIKIGHYKHKHLPNIKTQIPAIVDFNKCKGLNICFNKTDADKGNYLIQNIALRFLLSLPENLININIFDASSNGSNFSFLLALEKARLNLFTTEESIKNKLGEILNNFTKLQTEKLTFRYQTIEEYNISNPDKIPYQLIVISDYPEGFLARRDSVQWLKKIIENGLKYGVVVLMVSDLALLNKTNLGFSNEIENQIGKIVIDNNLIISSELIAELDQGPNNFSVFYDGVSPVNKLEIISFLNKRKSDFESAEKNRNNQKGKFNWYYDELKSNNGFWKLSSAHNIIIPLGFPVNYSSDPVAFFENYTIKFDRGFSYFYLGKETDKNEEEFGDGNYHCLIGGGTGSGKSVLINNILINTCYLYSPEELMFVIIDLKGSDYPQYTHLPHIKILFQDNSKIDIALNILEFVYSQYTERVNLFKKTKSTDFANYRKGNKLPRLVCIIDEFQTFNQTANAYVKNRSAEIIDLIVGKGRSYGIHLILSSQSLSNAKIEQASLSNINVRLVLRLDENATKQILSIGNNENVSFPDLQLVYNNKEGHQKQDNKIIKIPFLKGDLITQHLDYLNSKVKSDSSFSGKRYLLPGETEVYINANPDLFSAFTLTEISADKYIYIGTPYFIKDDDNYFEFLPETENNLLILGQELKTAYRLLFLIMCQFLSKNKLNAVKYIQYTPKSSPYFGLFNGIAADNGNLSVFELGDAENIYNEILEEINLRRSFLKIDNEILLILPQLNTDTSLNVRTSAIMGKIKEILEKGPVVGVYSIIFIESYNSFNEINTIGNFSKFKIATKGGESHKIITEKKVVDDEGFIYLNAPSPYAVINPDYINVYNSFNAASLAELNENVKRAIVKLFDEIN